MKRINVVSLTSALLVLGGASTVSAQSSLVGISLRAGLVFPTSSSTSSAAGSTLFGFGMEYKIANLEKSTEYHSHAALSIDYFARNGFNETPILLNYVIRKDSIFGSLGAGVDFDDVTHGSSTTHFGYQAGLGYDLPVTGVPIFVEAKFWGNDNSKYDAAGVYLGVRF